jgi:protein phosphatase PTC2/3
VCNNKVTHETELYTASNHQVFTQIDKIPEESEERIFGPWRVKPGGLSVDRADQVSRTFGDIESKMKDFGGIPGIVVAEPEISVFQHSEDMDYVLLGCDGIFDALTNEEVNSIVWETVNYYKSHRQSLPNAYQMCLNDCVNNVLKKSLIQHSEDNVTVIFIAFRDLFE